MTLVRHLVFEQDGVVERSEKHDTKVRAKKAPRGMRRIARRQLLRELGLDRSWQVLTAADESYPAIAARLPPSGFGAGHLLRIGAYAIALRHALDQIGHDESKANALISDIVFASVMPARTALHRLGRLRHRNAMDAAGWSSRLARRVYYTEPDWEMQDVPVASGFGMDVNRCVIAEFFQSFDMSDLCQAAICDQDIRSAAHHGLVLTRSGTLAGGSDRCDFRYHSGSPAGQPGQSSGGMS